MVYEPITCYRKKEVGSQLWEISVSEVSGGRVDSNLLTRIR